MLKGAKRFFLLFFSCLALFIMVLPVHVFADSATYIDVPVNTLIEVAHREKISDGTVSNQYYGITDSSSVRCVVLGDTSTVTIYFISLSSFQYGFSNNTPTMYNSTTTYVDNVQYHFGTVNYVRGSSAYIVVPDAPFVETTRNNANAVYYTFGDGAVSPEEVIEYGNINNLGYHTNIAGSGNAAINNFDVITWDSITDTLGNKLPEDATINIRVVPGNYSAASKQGLLEKLYSDFILNRTGLVQVASVSASQESFKISWRSVVDRLNIPFSSINSLISTDETWLKYGWIYECQLSIPSADHLGDWQTVYSSTSSGVENDMIIISNSIAINQELINVMQSINVLNDNDSVWYINDVPVDPNPTYTPPEDDTDEPWYMKILEMIYNSIGVTNEYINNGTSQSQNESDILNNNNNTLNTTVNEYHIVEDEIVQDMDNNIQDLDIDSELLSETGFINSARWISEQFTRIITDNPIGLILKFSLILGVSLIFLGRFR